jgi:hypothetical protein
MIIVGIKSPTVATTGPMNRIDSRLSVELKKAKAAAIISGPKNMTLKYSANRRAKLRGRSTRQT